MKKINSIITLMLLISILLTGIFSCQAKPAPTPIPPTATPKPQVAAPPPAATPAPTAIPKPTAAPVKPIEIRIAVGVAQDNATGITAATWAEEIEKKSAGRLKPILYWGEALGKATTYADLVEAGGAEVGGTYWSWYPGRFPLLEVMNLPFAWPSGDIASRVYYDLYSKGYFDKEVAKYKLVALGSLSPYNCFSTMPTRTPDALKGKKIRSGGGPWTTLIQKWGAAPISMPALESYSALEKKIIDGSILSAGSAYSFKLHEVAKNFTLINMGGFGAGYTMNLNFYNNLPPDLKKVVDESFLYMKEANLGKNYDKADVTALETFKTSGVNIYTPTPSEMEQWKAPVKETIDQWIEDLEKKGLSARKLIEDMVIISAKYGAKPY